LKQIRGELIRQIVHLLLQLNQKIVETDKGRVNPSDCAFTAPVKPKDRMDIDNNVNAKKPDIFIFILNHNLQYLCFQSN